jgi:hypothetical protein
MSELSRDLLMIEFLSWLSTRRRTYSEAMNAWQSTCPRHTIWEDAIIDGYIAINRQEMLQDPEVALTASGLALLNGRNGRI